MSQINLSLKGKDLQSPHPLVSPELCIRIRPRCVDTFPAKRPAGSMNTTAEGWVSKETMLFTVMGEIWGGVAACSLCGYMFVCESGLNLISRLFLSDR